MPLPIIWCLLVGDDSIFPVEINGTQTVAHLKEAIKAKIQSLALFDAHTLSLSLVNITGPDERACIEEAKRRAQDLAALRTLDSAALLSDVFVRSGRVLDLGMLRKFNPFAPLIDFLMPQVSPGPVIHILVRPPHVVSSIYESIYSVYASVDAVVRLSGRPQSL